MPKWAIVLVSIASVPVALVMLAAIGLCFVAGATFPPDAVIVQGRNMAPTLLPGDRVLVNAQGDYRSGSIVVFDDPTREGRSLISRIVATGGQTIDLGKDGAVYVDGELMSEPYVHGARTYPFDSSTTYPLRVPDDSVWVMGDDRSVSADSRMYGPVPVSSIHGVPAARWWPLARFTRFHDGE